MEQVKDTGLHIPSAIMLLSLISVLMIPVGIEHKKQSKLNNYTYFCNDTIISKGVVEVIESIDKSPSKIMTDNGNVYSCHDFSKLDKR